MILIESQRPQVAASCEMNVPFCFNPISQVILIELEGQTRHLPRDVTQASAEEKFAKQITSSCPFKHSIPT